MQGRLAQVVESACLTSDLKKTRFTARNTNSIISCYKATTYRCYTMSHPLFIPIYPNWIPRDADGPSWTVDSIASIRSLDPRLPTRTTRPSSVKSNIWGTRLDVGRFSGPATPERGPRVAT